MPERNVNIAQAARLGEAATGTIDPETRGVASEVIQDAAECLHGDEFFVRTDLLLPCQCVDGRHRADGSCEPAPNAAGGSESAVIADALTTQRLMNTSDTVATHAAKVFATLGDYEIGGHRDVAHADSEKSGCGANDKLGLILAKITDESSAIRAFLTVRGIAVTGTLHTSIVERASELVDRDYAATAGEAVTQVTETHDGMVELLDGPHNEAILVVNTAEGTTLDRAKFREEFGDDVEAFNVDVWALQHMAEATSITTDEITPKFVAALYYNVATALTLAGPSVRVVTR